MTDADRILAERLAAFADPRDDADWLDVRRRAGTARRRGWFLAPLAAALALVAVGAAFGLHRDVVDFVRAEPAPERIVVDFERQRAAAAFFRHGPDVVPGQARRVTTFEVHGAPRPFYVVPTEDGGFCWRLESRVGTCGRTTAQDSDVLNVAWLENPGDGPSELTGHVLDPDIARVELRYEDGARTEIPIVWVSPPIDAGFFHFEVAAERTKAGKRATVLLAVDGDGDVLGRRPFRYSDPRWEQAPDGLPRIADRSRKRRLFDFRDETGKRWWLDVAPAPGDRLCFAFNAGGGCNSPRFPSGMPLGIAGGVPTMTVCCTVEGATAVVELVYHDGTRTTLRPREGFLLYAIPSDRYERGRRLREIVERDASGAVVKRHDARPESPGRYPCAEADEIDLGHGQTVCP